MRGVLRTRGRCRAAGCTWILCPAVEIAAPQVPVLAAQEHERLRRLGRIARQVLGQDLDHDGSWVTVRRPAALLGGPTENAPLPQGRPCGRPPAAAAGTATPRCWPILEDPNC